MGLALDGFLVLTLGSVLAVVPVLVSRLAVSRSEMGGGDGSRAGVPSDEKAPDSVVCSNSDNWVRSPELGFPPELYGRWELGEVETDFDLEVLRGIGYNSLDLVNEIEET